MLLNSGKKLATTASPAQPMPMAHAAFKPVMYDRMIPRTSSGVNVFRISVAPVIRTSVGFTPGACRGKEARRRLAKSDCAMDTDKAPETSWKTVGQLSRTLS